MLAAIESAFAGSTRGLASGISVTRRLTYIVFLIVAGISIVVLALLLAMAVDLHHSLASDLNGSGASISDVWYEVERQNTPLPPPDPILWAATQDVQVGGAAIQEDGAKICAQLSSGFREPFDKVLKAQQPPGDVDKVMAQFPPATYRECPQSNSSSSDSEEDYRWLPAFVAQYVDEVNKFPDNYGTDRENVALFRTAAMTTVDPLLSDMGKARVKLDQAGSTQAKELNKTERSSAPKSPRDAWLDKLDTPDPKKDPIKLKKTEQFLDAARKMQIFEDNAAAFAGIALLPNLALAPALAVLMSFLGSLIYFFRQSSGEKGAVDFGASGLRTGFGATVAVVLVFLAFSGMLPWTGGGGGEAELSPYLVCLLGIVAGLMPDSVVSWISDRLKPAPQPEKTGNSS